jgi:hypothetical protein
MTVERHRYNILLLITQWNFVTMSKPSGERGNLYHSKGNHHVAYYQFIKWSDYIIITPPLQLVRISAWKDCWLYSRIAASNTVRMMS